MIDIKDSPTVEVHQSSTPNSMGKIIVNLNVNGHQVPFQVDTGATCSLVGLQTYRQLENPDVDPTNKIVTAYCGNEISVKGVSQVMVEWSNIRKRLPLMIVNRENVSNILGLDWFHELQFQISIHQSISSQNCFSVSDLDTRQNLKSAISKLLENHTNLFSPSLGLCTSFKADIMLKHNARPKYCKAYNLPFAQYDDVKKEIDRLVAIGVLKSVKSSEWASPIVIAKKPNGIRMCADFKVSVNRQIEIERYPIPRIEELFQKMQGGQYFTKIDLSEAYLQIELSESSKSCMVINTPFGLYQYQRLPYGIASAPGIFQRFMEELIMGIPGCAVYLDDVIITGRNNEEHLQNLTELLTRLEQQGLRCKSEKCNFAEERIEYVGHVIDSKGVLPLEKRLDGLKLMPRPKNLKELEAFIGKLNYYNKFVQNFSSRAAPLNELRKNNVKFVWTDRQEKAFVDLKDTIVNVARLVHYQNDLPIVLATDASKYGIGAVISHIYPDGSEKPISFASKTLNSSQLNYSQVEKEALSIIFGVTKFHQYLYGRKFDMVTDHQALTTLFGPNKKLPIMTLHRLQRWAIILQSYSYNIRYKPTQKHSNADALSRLPIGEDLEFDQKEKSLFNIEDVHQISIDDFPINSEILTKYTDEDTTLSEISKFIVDGWPNSWDSKEGNIKPYYDRKCSLSFQNGIILLHSEHTRVVIPKNLQEKILQMLHDGHWGKARMKQIARRCIWFPKIDQAIDQLCANCSICRNASPNPKRQFSSWPRATEPWERIHVDYAGPFFNSMWLVVVDSYSKFPYVVEVQNATSSSTIACLQKIFSVEGLPKTMVSDNGPQFTSSEFQQFCKLNAIEHMTSAPFHPASNGLAERTVRTFKESFKKIMGENSNKEVALFKYLATYRATPDPVSQKSPAELLHGRQPRTILSALLPSSHEKHTSKTKFTIGQKVYSKNYAGKSKWVEGTITKVLGTMMYNVQTRSGSVRRHQNQLKERHSDTIVTNTNVDTGVDFDVPTCKNQTSTSCTYTEEVQTPPRTPISPLEPTPERIIESPAAGTESIASDENTTPSSTARPAIAPTRPVKSAIPVRRSTRTIKKVVRFDL